MTYMLNLCLSNITIQMLMICDLAFTNFFWKCVFTFKYFDAIVYT